MSKDKLQIGDLVTHSLSQVAVGLVAGCTPDSHNYRRWEIYWFKREDSMKVLDGLLPFQSEDYLIKLKPTPQRKLKARKENVDE